jgi:hypothetical protein
MTLYTFLASYGGYTWALDSSQRRALLTVPLTGFDRGRTMWALVRMLVYDQLGDSLASKAFADSAAVAFQQQYPGVAADSDPDYGLALAYQGHRSNAIAAEDRYVALHPIDADFLDGPDNAEDVVKTYVRAGATTKGLDLLDRLLQMPGRLTPGRLRLDPSFAPLRGEPRFQRLVESRR